MNNLIAKNCILYQPDMKPLGLADVLSYRRMLSEGWEVYGNKKLSKEFHFKDFKSAMAFANDIAVIAEKENHHPDICINFKKVTIELSTHVINGLSENDFIIASQIDGIEK